MATSINQCPLDAFGSIIPIILIPRIENGQENLWLRCTRTREQYQVLNPRLTEEETAAVQDEVPPLLGAWDRRLPWLYVPWAGSAAAACAPLPA